MRVRALVGLNFVLLAAALAAAAATSRTSDWHPAGLVVLLAALALISDAVALTAKGVRLSGSFIALVLAMALLGPAPAVLIGVLVIAVYTVRGPRPAPPLILNNLATYAVFPLLGGLLIRALTHGVSPKSFEFAAAIFAVYVVTNLLNFVMVAGARHVFIGHEIKTQARTILRPLIPAEAAAATLVIAFSLAYAHSG